MVAIDDLPGCNVQSHPKAERNIRVQNVSLGIACNQANAPIARCGHRLSTAGQNWKISTSYRPQRASNSLDPRLSNLLENERAHAFGDHDGGQIRVGARGEGHHGGIANAKALHPDDAAGGIDDGVGIVRSANPAGA